jgi:Arc/MetJ-type ribon-helix-helix transcriptional regulator
MEARIAEHLKGAERDARPLKADLAERRAAFLEGLDAKVEAGELTRAEADEMIAKVEARHARHRQRTTGDTPDMSAALALARS